jgi:glycosyltransferase involved in cell wall biosynthesis
MIENTQIKVSVVMITYGHEKFIREAVESILSQICNFEIELIIGNDASPDNTDSVINNILKENPNAHKISYFKHEKNIGFMENHIFVLQQVKGNYIAICEGDDYWIDRQKLQKQFDFLEANPDFGMVFHDCKMLYEETNELKDMGIVANIEDREYSRLEIFEKWTIPTGSVFFRANLINEELYIIYRNKKALFGDTYTNLFVSKNKKIYGFKDKMSVYRIHHGGLTSVKTDLIKKYANFLIHWKFIIDCFGKEFFTEKMKTRFSESYFNLARLYYFKNNLIFIKFFILSFHYNRVIFFKLLSKKIKRNASRI